MAIFRKMVLQLQFVARIKFFVENKTYLQILDILRLYLTEFFSRHF